MESCISLQTQSVCVCVHQLPSNLLVNKQSMRISSHPCEHSSVSCLPLILAVGVLSSSAAAQDSQAWFGISYPAATARLGSKNNFLLAFG